MSTERSVSRRGFLQVTAGAAGVAGASGTAVAAEEEQDEQNGGEGTTHTVEMTDGLVFDPDSLTVAPGDTVVWENVGDQGHSVTAYEDSIPDATEYWASGGFDSEQAARDAYSASGGIEDAGNVPSGESWSRTFDTEGTHEYFCIPHEGAGMVGEIEVDPDAGSDGGSGGGGAPAIPDGAKAIGVATTVAMVTTLGLAFTLLKYGGGPAEE